eukprot:COSAG01_NODE_25142_length_754_cov_1.132824_1_plen_134_part_01
MHGPCVAATRRTDNSAYPPVRLYSYTISQNRLRHGVALCCPGDLVAAQTGSRSGPQPLSYPIHVVRPRSHRGGGGGAQPRRLPFLKLSFQAPATPQGNCRRLIRAAAAGGRGGGGRGGGGAGGQMDAAASAALL